MGPEGRRLGGMARGSRVLTQARNGDWRGKRAEIHSFGVPMLLPRHADKAMDGSEAWLAARRTDPIPGWLAIGHRIGDGEY